MLRQWYALRRLSWLKRASCQKEDFLLFWAFKQFLLLEAAPQMNLLADTLNALMALPNLVALALLSPIVFKITKEFFDSRGKSENNPF
ncbi:alanine:cation symporter family protein [bacterium]|nr:alanine:cation symporter family protein [bacterium]